MRNVRAVYTKLKDVKYVHLVKLYKKHLKRIPENCKYNYKYIISGKAPIHLCLFHQPGVDLDNGIFPHLVDICQDMQHCKNCNAFVSQYNKKDIQKFFEWRLENKKLKEREYPDLCALEWVLEQSVLGIPPLNIIQKIWFYIKKWLSKNKVL
jgi:hypothetical protein